MTLSFYMALAACGDHGGFDQFRWYAARVPACVLQGWQSCLASVRFEPDGTFSYLPAKGDVTSNGRYWVAGDRVLCEWDSEAADRIALCPAQIAGDTLMLADGAVFMRHYNALALQ